MSNDTYNNLVKSEEGLDAQAQRIRDKIAALDANPEPDNRGRRYLLAAKDGTPLDVLWTTPDINRGWNSLIVDWPCEWDALLNRAMDGHARTDITVQPIPPNIP